MVIFLGGKSRTRAHVFQWYRYPDLGVIWWRLKVRWKGEVPYFQLPKTYFQFLTPFCNLKRYFEVPWYTDLVIFSYFGHFWESQRLGNTCWLNHTNVFKTRNTVVSAFQHRIERPCTISHCGDIKFWIHGNFGHF